MYCIIVACIYKRTNKKYIFEMCNTIHFFKIYYLLLIKFIEKIVSRVPYLLTYTSRLCNF